MGAVWASAANATTAQIAREWMGWSPPARCGEVAKTLAVRSTVLGQALAANQQAVEPTSALAAVEPEPAPATAAPAPEPVAVETPPAPAPKPAPVSAPKPAPRPALKPAVAAAPRPAAPKVASIPSATLPVGAFIIDPDNPRGCPGKLDPRTNNGRIVMVCLP